MGGSALDRYVVGFAFSESLQSLLVVEKQRPPWMVGLLNGVGGHIESGELPAAAMRRECWEETRLVLEWQYRGVLEGVNNDDRQFECHVFYAYDDKIWSFQQVEEEPLSIVAVTDLGSRRTVAGLSFLIPFGMCPDGSSFIKVSYTKWGFETV